MVSPDADRRLEQNDRRIDASGRFTTFTEAVPAVATRHAHPAWKVVICPQGLVTVEHPDGDLTAPGVAVPPGASHRAFTSAPYLAVFVDPWTVGRERRGFTGFTRSEATWLSAVPQERIAEVFGPPETIDARLTQALEALATADSIAALAARVGLSAPRLRALVRERIDIPLVQLRRWQRLRRALASLGDGSVASAAFGAGFADQPHFTRVSRQLLGRTPGTLLPHRH
jgi:AraC-like DNA-binding protein